MMQYSMGMVKAKLKTSFTARPLEIRVKKTPVNGGHAIRQTQ